MASLGSTRGEPEDDGCTKEDARISKAGLVDFFAALPLLQELVLDVYQHVREALHSKCPELKLLKLGQFHGFCVAIETQLDGGAVDWQSLKLRDARRLITMKGMRTVASLLHKTLTEVKISCCAVASLRSLEPVQDLIERLHVDCVRDGCEEEHEYASTKKKCKYSSHPDFSSCKQSNGNRFFCKSWKRLRYLSLWIGAGELVTPLPMTGLDVCLSKFGEISIRVERDCRSGHKATNHRSVNLD
ncbi:hypothetical protein POTOM_008807 [Populus tomentosa]|uniref:Uncharacterized protein n=1 Tax=Populus tomentosa TaxID=118781 RepID=A0A8X8AMZ7_POPTO|nr:hypothetical protein POTOM_008807 [Populus tomentosa]